MNFNSEWDLLWIPYSPQTCDAKKAIAFKNVAARVPTLCDDL